MSCSLCGQSFCSCVDAVKTSDALLRIVEGEVQLTRHSETHYRCPCPLHGGEDENFAIWKHADGTWLWKCHSRCGRSGTVIDYCRERYGYTLPETLRLATGGRAPAPVPRKLRAAPEPQPEIASDLGWDDALLFRANLDRPEAVEQRAWWHARGVSDAMIDRFSLGYCLRCPTAWAREDRKWSSPSYTIPITDGGVVRDIRHRLAAPWRPSDRYFPHARGLGMHLFNRDSLRVWPDGSPRAPGEQEVVLIEGEIKTIVLATLGFEDYVSLVSLTAGAEAWLGERGAWFVDQLREARKVVVLFDPDAAEAAERTARRFGKRGAVAALGEKVDDLLIAGGAAAMLEVLAAISEARVPREASYWQPQQRHRGGQYVRV